MARPRIPRPSAPTTIALLALVVAMSGTAYAVTATQVNIADKRDPSHTAAVDATGALSVKSAGGKVAVTSAGTPFNLSAISFEDSHFTGQFSPTSATLAITSITVANGTAYNTVFTLYEFPETGPYCLETGGAKFVLQYVIPAGQTLPVSLPTPLMLKPLASASTYCLGTYAYGNTGSGFYTNFGGYVASGTFASASASAPLPGAPTRTDLKRAPMR
jgi:hypothetical protein